MEATSISEMAVSFARLHGATTQNPPILKMQVTSWYEPGLNI
jgi:hypothetical protein